MKSTTSSPTGRPPKEPYSDREAKLCPECGGTVRFNRRYPVLTGRLPGRVALSPDDTNATERLRYITAWVCETETCAYWKVVSEV